MIVRDAEDWRHEKLPGYKQQDYCGEGQIDAVAAMDCLSQYVIYLHLSGKRRRGEPMKISGKLLALGFAAAMVAFVAMIASAQQMPVRAPLYNTVKAKLLAGKQVFSFTQTTADPVGYCEKAKHYDYTWFEMQHSTLEYKDIER